MLVVRPRRQLHTPHTRRRVSWMTQKLSFFGTFTRLLVFVVFVYAYRMSDQGGGASGIDLTMFATPPGTTGSTDATQALSQRFDLLIRCTVRVVSVFGCI